MTGVYMTSVCNVRVAHIRPQYRDLAAWCESPDNVYVGRKGVVFINGVRFPEKDSIWANPFKVKDASRADVIAQYREYITARLEDSPELWEELEALRGKRLGCWCKPLACHADVLIELLEQRAA
jgi:hypothetical protein